MFRQLLVFTCLFLFQAPAFGAHQQWVKLSLANKILSDQPVSLSLANITLKWGHFYVCSDEKRQRIPTPTHLDIPNMNTSESPTTLQLCMTGAKFSPTGVEGSMNVTVVNIESNQEIYRASVKWDSPALKAKNLFALDVNGDEKIKMTCKDDYNKKGGALGNIECTIEGRIKDKMIQ